MLTVSRGKLNLLQSYIGCRFLSLRVGDRASLRRTFTAEDVQTFANLTGDSNLLHCDPNYARQCGKGWKDSVVHGALLNGLVSAVIGTQLPGTGTILVRQELVYPAPCYPGEEVEATVTVTAVRKLIAVEYECRVNATEKVVLQGKAQLVVSFKGK